MRGFLVPRHRFLWRRLGLRQRRIELMRLAFIIKGRTLTPRPVVVTPASVSMVLGLVLLSRLLVTVRVSMVASRLLVWMTRLSSQLPPGFHCSTTKKSQPASTDIFVKKSGYILLSHGC